MAVTVLSQLAAAGVAPGAAGLATVPAVFAHLVQILIDSVLTARWQSEDAHRRLQPPPERSGFAA